MASAVQDAVIAYLQKNPNADNVEVANHVRRTVSGAETTPSSVASIKSRLKQMGGLVASTLVTSGVEGFAAFEEPDVEETEEMARARIMVRYGALKRNVYRVVDGKVPALIVSGPPGLGKSFEFREAIKQSGRRRWIELSDDLGGSLSEEHASEVGPTLYDTISGSITAVGLYQALWNMRKGGFLLLDDVDAVFRDEDALNLLKAALDSDPDHRYVSWRKEAKWLEDYGIPKTFKFEGQVAFLTNVDFESVIAKGSKDAEHFKALIDRSFYLCLTLRTARDFMIRIRQVALGEGGMLDKQFGCTPEESEEILAFVEEHQTKFYNLSLRLVGQIAQLRKDDPEGWRDDVIATKTKTR